MVVLALALLYLDFNSLLSRAFGVFLLARAYTNLMPVFLEIGPDLAGRLYPYAAIVVAPAAIYFLLVYRERYSSASPRPRLRLALLVATLALQAAYLLDHSLFGAYTVSSDGSVSDMAGPLRTVDDAAPLAYALVALVLAKDCAGSRTGPRSQALKLASLGFALDATFLIVTQVTGLLSLVAVPLRPGEQVPGVNAGGMWATIGLAMRLAGLLPLALLAIGPLRKAPEGADPRRWWARYSVLVAAAAGSAVLTVVGGVYGWFDAFLGYLIVDRVWTVLFPLFIMYALVRHRLFEVDVKIKWTISRGTMAAAFLAVFFVVAQLAQAYLTSEYGLLLGGVSAGLLLFVLSPLQRLAERVAETAMPGVKPASAMDQSERLRAYLESARVAWADGVLDKSERAMLERLRETLGLSLEDASRLEREAAAA